MGLLDKLFRVQFTPTCGDISVEKIKQEQAKIRIRLDEIHATLNGEDGWFLRLEKQDHRGERT